MAIQRKKPPPCKNRRSRQSSLAVLSALICDVLWNQMRGDDIDELAGRDDLGFLPEFWKMALVAGYEIVSAGGIGTFEKDIVARINGDLKRLRGRNKVSAALNELKELKANPFPNAEFRTRQHCPSFQKHP